MKIRIRILYVVLSVAQVLFAHHSFQAEYDRNKVVRLQGTVKQLEWMNPHARLYLDVKDDRGQLITWIFELGSPNVLRRLGWSREALHPGDAITVEGYRAKDGANMANAKRVTMANGQQVSAGSSADVTQSQ
jgi:Family of unknown function (DUF6152)